MWARTKIVDGQPLVFHEESWYDILEEGVVAVFVSLYAFLTLGVVVLMTPFVALKAFIDQRRFQDKTIPLPEVRERAHLA